MSSELSNFTEKENKMIESNNKDELFEKY